MHSFALMGEAITHMGALIHKVVEESGVKKTVLAKRLGFHVRTLYLHFDSEVLEPQVVARYGRALKYDFSKDIPELAPYIRAADATLLLDSVAEYGNNREHELMRELERWKTEAYELQKKLLQMMEENAKLKSDK